jgi:hypothetical protein
MQNASRSSRAANAVLMRFNEMWDVISAVPVLLCPFPMAKMDLGIQIKAHHIDLR